MKYDLKLLQSGSLEELKEEVYPLISGDYKIGESAKQVKEYFEKGTPFPMAEGVKIEHSGCKCVSVGCGYLHVYF